MKRLQYVLTVVTALFASETIHASPEQIAQLKKLETAQTAYKAQEEATAPFHAQYSTFATALIAAKTACESKPPAATCGGLLTTADDAFKTLVKAKSKADDVERRARMAAGGSGVQNNAIQTGGASGRKRDYVQVPQVPGPPPPRALPTKNSERSLNEKKKQADTLNEMGF
jgi:hypothetical protein